MMKVNFFWKQIATLTGLISVNISVLPLLVHIPLVDSLENTVNSSLVSLEFPPSPNRKTPKESAGAGRRGPCDYNNSEKPANEFLVALMPDRIENKGNLSIKYYSLAKTALLQPSFWFYIPENKAKSANFNIVDDQGNTITTLNLNQLPDKPGIIKISLPQDTKLERNKEYNWSFSLVCTSSLKSTVAGKITTVELDSSLQSQLNQIQDPLKKARFYADNGLWNETLAILASLYPSNPQEWKQLLESVGLQEYSDQPLLDYSN